MLEKVRQREIQFLKEAYIVGATLAKAASDSALYEQDFDVVILDDPASMAMFHKRLLPQFRKRVIICGDFKQLPPIASSRDPLVEQC